MSTERGSAKRSIIPWMVLFVLLLLVVSLGKGIFELLSVYDRVDLLEQEVLEVEQKHTALALELEEKQRGGYLERQIRDMLHLSKPGDVVVVLPETQMPSSLPFEQAEQRGEKANWQEWLELFWVKK